MSGDSWLLAIRPDGAARAIYDDRLAPVFAALGRPVVTRAGRVEPVTEDGFAIGWQADLSPVGGPVLGPFASRRDALEAEREWLTREVYRW